jgi:hypothetical protein
LTFCQKNHVRSTSDHSCGQSINQNAQPAKWLNQPRSFLWYLHLNILVTLHRLLLGFKLNQNLNRCVAYVAVQMRVSGVRPLLVILDKDMRKYLSVLNDKKALDLVSRKKARSRKDHVRVLLFQGSVASCFTSRASPSNGSAHILFRLHMSPAP